MPKSSALGPLVVVSSWLPRDCGIATFTEEALEYAIKRNLPERQVHVFSHTDGENQNGEVVHPIIDLSITDWWADVAEEIISMDPYVVHLEHEYGLYEHHDAEGNGDWNQGFLDLLQMLHKIPTVVEPHTVHLRPNEHEVIFLEKLFDYSTIVVVKNSLVRMKLQDWELNNYKDYSVPHNIGVIRHGSMTNQADLYDRATVLEELGLSRLQDKNITMLVGWIQSNKRWDYIIEQWPDILREVESRGGNSGDWHLLAAGKLRDPETHQESYERYISLLEPFIEQGKATFYEFTPRNSRYYGVMSLADIVLLPSIDETQSGTLARIHAMHKPYVTLEVEGLGLQTTESQAGLLATSVEEVVDRTVDLMINGDLRKKLSKNSADYVMTRTGWDTVVGPLYIRAFEEARAAMQNGGRAVITRESPLYNGHF